ncbi:MAG: cutinase, partial [Rhodococcus sp. (in: high G+C Gram-positive bacteria)]
AFSDIAAQDNWLASDETFLDVLLKVSEPGYKPGVVTKPVAKVDEAGEPLPASEAVNLAYLPSKIAKEIIGFIGSNTNTVQVVMNDPYGQTLGPGSGHHFDYWRDADPAKGKPLTSAQYAAAWLTQLAKDAEAGKPIKTAAVQENARLAVLADPATATATTTSAAPTTTSAVTAPPAVPAELAPIAPAVVAPPVEPALPVAPALPVEPALPVAPALPADGTQAVEGTQPAEGTVTTTTAVPTTVAPTTTPAP